MAVTTYSCYIRRTRRSTTTCITTITRCLHSDFPEAYSAGRKPLQVENLGKKVKILAVELRLFERDVRERRSTSGIDWPSLNKDVGHHQGLASNLNPE